MPQVLALVLAAAAVLSAGAAILGMKLFLRLLLRGPHAAEEAFEKGDTVRAWFNAAQTPATLDGPRDIERLAFAARSHSQFGEVMVEERASCPSYAS